METTIKPPQEANRRTAVIVGVLFILGTLGGVLSVILTGPIMDVPDYLDKIAANETKVIAGAICVLVMGCSLAMVPVMMYPIFRKYNRALALGAVVFRGALEAVVYIAMVISWLLLIVLSREYAIAGAPQDSYFQTLGTVLVEADDLMNPILQIVFSIGTFMFYYLFYQSKLIYCWLSLWGMIGAVLFIVWAILAMFGTDLGFLLIPLALQEMVLAIWLIIKGFNHPEIPSDALYPTSNE